MNTRHHPAKYQSQSPLPASPERPLVSVVITSYNQGEFLKYAIESVMDQTYRVFEILVVNDGSSDSTAQVAQGYKNVELINQENLGISSARNKGLNHAKGDYVVFLDADDRLLPKALEKGLDCFTEHGDCAFVFGNHIRVNMEGDHLPTRDFPRIDRDYYLWLLRGNIIGMHATVMYRRSLLVSIGGFDESLPMCEDYDVYLRLASQYPIRGHNHTIAEYLWHGTNTSGDSVLMLKSALNILKSNYFHSKTDNRTTSAYRQGIRYWKRYYSKNMLMELKKSLWPHFMPVNVLRNTISTLRYAPAELIVWGQEKARNFLLGLLRSADIGKTTQFLKEKMSCLIGRRLKTPINLGDLCRLSPVSNEFGFDRDGGPIDRHYIEGFLKKQSADIHGRVLEMGDNKYTRMFGGSFVTISDIFDINAANPCATLVGDLTQADHIPSNTFDCIILTQTLQLIYDVRAAISTVYRILKPGGILLATVPGVSQIAKDQWGKTWYWSFTALSMRQILSEVFPGYSISLETYGNVLAAAAFLYGLGANELGNRHLAYHDSHYQLIVAARAVKEI